MQTQYIPGQLAPNDGNAVLTIGLLGVNFFGPQSPWRSLLGQREHLEHEISRAREYLQRIRKEPTPYGVPLQASPTDNQERGNDPSPGPARKASANGVMEQFLLGWLEQLENRLEAVTMAIEHVQTLARREAFHPEEPLLELLRATG